MSEIAAQKHARFGEELWVKCPTCNEIMFRKDVERNLKVCPFCDYHFRITAKERIDQLLDPDSFEEYDADLRSTDPLSFKDVRSYKDRLKLGKKRTGLNNALVSGIGCIQGVRVTIGVFEFDFLGGSMGAVVGEKILRCVRRAIDGKTPLVIISSSGGARMHEGIVSLMQMAKAVQGVILLNRYNIPFISVLADPVTGGVAASYAFLGDIIIAEPKALVGFAGPRVIEETMKQKLPEGFQRAEFLFERGMIDDIISRHELKKKLAAYLYHLWPKSKTAYLKKIFKRGLKDSS